MPKGCTILNQHMPLRPLIIYKAQFVSRPFLAQILLQHGQPMCETSFTANNPHLLHCLPIVKHMPKSMSCATIPAYNIVFMDCSAHRIASTSCIILMALHLSANKAHYHIFCPYPRLHVMLLE